ncbi:MAG TPA: hypothetical protein VGP06_07845 [Janthinobacterium sp.]|jgi:hypothetical protein|nr:hypothetical protein [Janthinobacterium sp.]
MLVALALSACASLGNPGDPGKDRQYVSLVNSLSWTNALSGKRDGSRSSWPLKNLAGQDEVFPLAQLKQCDQAGAACAWGVMSAHRSVSAIRYVPGGVTLDLAMHVDVDRRQEMHKPEFNTAMAIPADVASLRSTKEFRRTLTLQYGKIQHIDFDYGVGFDVCVLRYDAAGQALDMCEIPYI